MQERAVYAPRHDQREVFRSRSDVFALPAFEPTRARKRNSVSAMRRLAQTVLCSTRGRPR